MNIVAIAGEGFLLSATADELKAIMAAVTGKTPEKAPIIGDKIPAYDYGATILAIREFRKGYHFRKFKESVEEISAQGARLVQALEQINFDSDEKHPG